MTETVQVTIAGTPTPIVFGENAVEAARQAELATLAANSAVAAGNYFTSQALGEAGTTTGQLFSTDDGAGNLIYYKRTGGGSTEIGRALTPASLLSGVQSNHLRVGAGPLPDYVKTGVHINRTVTGHAYYGILDQTTADHTGSVDPVIGAASFNVAPKLIGNVSVDHYHGLQFTPDTTMTGGSTIGVLAGLWTLPTIPSGTISQLSGAKINNPTGAGTVVNNYGVLVDVLTKGTTNNIGVYVGGASGASGNNYAFFSAGNDVASYFGGPLEYGRGVTKYGEFGYDPTLGHTVLQARDTYDFKLVKGAGSSYVPYLRFGDTVTDTDDTKVGYNTSTGNFEIVPRSTFGTLITRGNFHLGAAAARIMVGADTATTPDTQLHLKATNDKSGVTLENTAGPNKWQILPSETGIANVGLCFYDTVAASNKIRLYIDPDGHTRPGTDDAFTLGRPTYGWAVVHLHYNKYRVKTVATLTAAATIGAGGKAFVSDSSVAASGNFGAVVAGGGANQVPVFSDGTNWRIG